jgi:hypothetical protein
MTPEEVLPLREPVVSTPTPPSNQPETPRGRESQHPTITRGEVPFLWWFIHGNIMTPETWNAPLQAYGLCKRQAWVHISVEMSFRKRHFLGSVIQNRALVEKSVQAIETCQGIGSPERPLRGKGPCFLCALNIRQAGAGAAPPTQLALGRDRSGLRSFVIDLAALWPPKVCALGAGGVSGPSRRRSHLLADLKPRRLVALFWQHLTLKELPARLAGYGESFLAEANGSVDEDLAALMSGVGWCIGWHALVALLSNSA